MNGRTMRGPDPTAPDHLLTLGAGDARYLTAAQVASRQTNVDTIAAETMGYSRGARLICESFSNRTYTVSSTDLFAGASWDSQYDPYGCFYSAGQGGGGYASYARMRVPVSGRYELDCTQHMGRSGATVGSVASKVLVRTGNTAPTVGADSVATDLIQNVSPTDGPTHAWTRIYLNAGQWVYWAAWASPYKDVVQYGYGDIRAAMRMSWLGSV